MKTKKVDEELIPTTLVKIETIVPYHLNSKIHDEENIRKLTASISMSNGRALNPIIVDKDMVIIAGHGRLEAYKRLESKWVEVRIFDHLSKQQANILRIADNKTASVDYDASIMRLEVQVIDMTEIDAAALGFEAMELEKLVVPYDDIDKSAFTQDLNADVDNQSKEAEHDIKKTDLKMISVANGLGFKTVTVDATRKIARFIASLQEQYEVEDPMLAFMQFVDEMAAA